MAGQPHLLCSTGAFTRDPDRTDTAPWLWERASVAHVHVKDYDGHLR
jgi:hypothetical protein